MSGRPLAFDTHVINGTVLQEFASWPQNTLAPALLVAKS
jgi:hypothetical protein